jgi:MoaA/NifB/PqqE/SkfB family radical SAM enzyme
LFNAIEGTMENLTDVLDISSDERCIRHIDIHLTEHCNLNCAYCCHCSTIAEPEFLDIKQFERDIARLSMLANGRIEGILLLGGEPLLNPDVIRIVQITRQYVPKGRINILTNGILLAKMKADFWDTCQNNDVTIHISRYPIKLDTDKIFKIAKQYEVNVLWFSTRGRNNRDDVFRVQKFDMSGKRDIYKAYENCVCRSMFLKDGNIYLCPPMPSSRHLEKRFGIKFDVSKEDFLSLDNVNNLQEILDFISRPTPFCRYCTFENQFIPWKISEKKSEEWIL